MKRLHRRYAVYSRYNLIGTTALEYTLVFGEWAGGVFYPTPPYRRVPQAFANLQHALERDTQAVRRFLEERDRLGFELWLSGERLDGAIELISQWNAGKCVIHVRTSDPRVWNGRGD